jgi:hypothetical protein
VTQLLLVLLLSAVAVAVVGMQTLLREQLAVEQAGNQA